MEIHGSNEANFSLSSRKRPPGLDIFVGRLREVSLYKYSNMAPRLSGQDCIFLKSLLLSGYKENASNYRSLP